MACTIDWSFLTDGCRPDNGELRLRLEELCELANAPINVIDPNAGGCGQWAPNGTVTEVSYNPATRDLTIGGQEASTAYLLSALNSVTLAPTDISAVGTYLGTTVNVAFNNPSSCDAVLFYGNFYNTNIVQLGNNKLHRLELRDITLGAPGPLIADLQKQFQGGAGNSYLTEEVHVVPFFVIVPPGGSFNNTYRGEIVTAATAAGSPSLWFQNQIQIVAQGVPI